MIQLVHYDFPKLKLIAVVSFVLLFSCFERQVLTLRNTLATHGTTTVEICFRTTCH